MKDLLSDIAGTTSDNTNNLMINNNNATTTTAAAAAAATQSNSYSGNDIFLTLNSLERELDNAATSTTTTKIPSSLPPPGLSQPSAGAMIVNHASTVPNVTTTKATDGEDAWSQALSQFSALSLTDDFLKADSQRKEQQQQLQVESQKIVESILFEDDEYDERGDGSGGSSGAAAGGDYNSDTKINNHNHMDDDITKKAMVGLFPGLMSSQVNGSISGKDGATNNNNNIVDTPDKSAPVSTNGGVSTPMQQQPPFSSPSYPNIMMSRSPGPGPYPFPTPPPPHMMHMMPPPPHIMPGGGPPHPLPPHMMPPHIMPGRGPPHPFSPHMMMQGHGPPPGVLPHPAMIAQMQMMQQQQQQMHQTPQKKSTNSESTTTTTSDKQIFNKIDFPALGANGVDIEKERKEEEAKMKEEEEMKQRKKEEEEKENAQFRPTTVRLTFQDPSPNAPPVSAKSIPSTSMSPRDLCHVLHSIMRPLLTFENVLDAYNADYYHWSYNDRKSRNLLFNNNMGGNINLPNPVWKETKIKALNMESKFRDTVEKRADEWSKEKQALGKVAKANVKRPRALLATTALSSNAESRVTSGVDMDDELDENKQRALLWAARVGIDKGYFAYLNLVELRRLLTSRPGDTFNNKDVEDRREELLQDVEENVSKLNTAFGVVKNDESGEIEKIDIKVLSRSLSLPKGRMLLSRVVDEGILPHPSACHLLPFAIKVIFESASNADLTAAPPAGEDRLLRSLTGLVRTVKPSVDAQNLLSCLTSVIDTRSLLSEKNKNMKTILEGKRTLMELLHAIFTRGGEVCVDHTNTEWKAKESKFLSTLTSSE